MQATRYFHVLKLPPNTFGMIEDFVLGVLIESNLCLDSKLCFKVPERFKIQDHHCSKINCALCFGVAVD